MHLSRLSLTILLVLFVCIGCLAQAGRRTTIVADSNVSLNITAVVEENPESSISSQQLALFDNGMEQSIKGFKQDLSPARIVILLDTSLTLRVDPDQVAQVIREFVYEIYEGDKLMIVGYNERAEVYSDWTDDPKKVEAAVSGLKKEGEPRLFDALRAAVDEALKPLSGLTRKRVFVLISDGADRGSKTPYEEIMTELLLQDITVYAIQLPDRTGGALRRDQPKPKEVIQKLVETTGGLTFDIVEPNYAAKAVCDELKKNRYIVSYSPTNIPYGEARRLLVSGNEGIAVRAKMLQPSTIR